MPSIDEIRRYKSLRELDDDEVLIRVASDYEYFKAEKDKDNERATRYNAIYECLDNPDLALLKGSGDTEDDESRFSDTYLPIGAAIVDVVATKIFNAFFPNNEYFEIEATDWMDNIAGPRVTAHLMKRHREMYFKYTVYRTIIQACCFDYAITMTKWLTQPGFALRRETNKTMRQFGKIKLPHQSVEMKPRWEPDVIDRSDVELLNYFNCYHDPSEGAIDFNTSRAFIDVRYQKLEDLQNAAKNDDRPYGKYKNIDKVVNSILKRDEQIIKTAFGQGQTYGRYFVDNRRAFIQRYWTGDHVVEVCEGEVIWRKDLCGWPLQRWGIYERQNSFRKMGIVQRIERPQYDINASLNTRRDFQNLITDPIAVIDRDLVGLSGEIELTPGVPLISKGGDVTKKAMFYQPGSNINDGVMGDIGIQMDMMKSMAVSENEMGGYSSGRRPAAQTYAISDSSQNKTIRLAQILEETCLCPIYMQQFVLEATLLNKKESYIYHGREGDAVMDIDPGDYAWTNQPVFRAKGTWDLLNDPLKMAQFLKALELTATLPQLQKDTNWDAIKTYLWSKLCPHEYQNFIKDLRVPDRSVPPEDENFMAAHGRRLQVSPKDDSGAHVKSHTALTKTGDYSLWKQSWRDQFEAHIEEHQAAGQAELAMIAKPMAGGQQDQMDPARGLRPTAMSVNPTEAISGI